MDELGAPSSFVKIVVVWHLRCTVSMPGKGTVKQPHHIAPRFNANSDITQWFTGPKNSLIQKWFGKLNCNLAWLHCFRDILWTPQQSHYNGCSLYICYWGDKGGGELFHRSPPSPFDHSMVYHIKTGFGPRLTVCYLRYPSFVEAVVALAKCCFNALHFANPWTVSTWGIWMNMLNWN